LSTLVWRGTSAGLTACLALVVVLAGCGTSTRLIRRGGPSVAEARGKAADGPVARLALIKVLGRVKGADRKVCQGLGDMLTTALFQTGRFILLERRRLGPILAEQNLSRGGRVDPKTAAPIGKLEGAELLMMVDVVRFKRRELTLGGALLGAISIVGSVLTRVAVRDNRMPLFGVAYLTSTIWLDVKIVDARTGRVVLAGRIEGLGRDWGGGVLVTIPHLPLVLGHFDKTAMGRAIAEAVTTAANYVAARTPRRFFHAQKPEPGFTQVVPVARAEPVKPVAIPAITGRGRLIPVRTPLWARPAASRTMVFQPAKTPVNRPTPASKPAPGAPWPPAGVRPWW
jgi:curli biogenesis system outer membrane secretion channel CsgG